MRSWYVIYANKEHKCEFVSINILNRWIWLKLNNISFRVVYDSVSDYQDSKRGIEVRAQALNKSTKKLVKIVFK